MADYVNKNILSEAYVHIEMVELDSPTKEKFEHNLMLFTESRGKFAIYEDITPEVKTKDGSLKVYSSITGTLTEALGEYSTFEEALDNLYIDAKRLAEAMILETLFLAKARGRSVLRREARTGIIRSTKDLFDQVELAHAESDSDSPPAAIRRLAAIRNKYESLNNVLASEDDKTLIKIEVGARVRALPTPRKVKETQNVRDSTTYKAERTRLLTLLKI